MSKLTKYLESKTKDVKVNESGSCYYGFGSRLIRVSDHLPPIQRSEDLHILTSGNSGVIYTVAVFGKIYTFVKLGELKKFIDHWLIIITQMNRREDKTTDDRIIKLRESLDTLNKELNKIKSKQPVVVDGMSNNGKIIPFSRFTKGQQKVIAGFVKQLS